MEDQNNIKISRIYVVYFTMLVLGVAVIVQIVRLQFVIADTLITPSNDSTSVRHKEIPAERGSIYSADGKLMATSVPVFDIFMDVANPTIDDKFFAENVDSLALALSGLLKDKSSKEYSDLLKNSRRRGHRYLLIKRKVSYDQLTEIRKMPILRLGKYQGGLIVEPRDIRVMPYQLLAYRTIGWDKEGEDLDVGLEGAYSKELSGKKGLQLIKRLPNGVWKPVTTGYLVDPENGMDIHTTIDIYIQDIAENALLNQLKLSGAHHGCVVVMEVATGYIKAIANLQRNPNDSGYSERYNHAIGESFEPGSTFKLASIVAALEDGVLKLDDTVDIGGGVTTFANRQMKDASKRFIGKTTIRRAFEISSNVGVSKAIVNAYKGKHDKFSERLHNMKLGKPLGVEIPGEGAPYIKTPKSSSWSKTSLPWMSIGYELRLTPLQILTFYNAIANNGKMVKPQFVSHITNTGEVVMKTSPIVIADKIASPETIKQVHEMMIRVVDYGTAANIRNNIYKIAGKTGTARIASGDRGYEIPEYVASFAGFFPADNPKYSIIVIINKPSGAFYGSAIAAPVFKSISDKIYGSYLDMPHKAEFAFKEYTYPKPAKGKTSEINYLLKSLNINHIDTTNKEWAEYIDEANGIYATSLTFQENTMPDVRGMTIKDALWVLERRNLKVHFTGNGRIKSQSPEPGALIRQGGKCNLTLNQMH